MSEFLMAVVMVLFRRPFAHVLWLLLLLLLLFLLSLLLLLPT